MYRRPKFLEVLLKIREEMAREADFDADLFAEMVRLGSRSTVTAVHRLCDDGDDSVRKPAIKRARKSK